MLIKEGDTLDQASANEERERQALVAKQLAKKQATLRPTGHCQSPECGDEVHPVKVGDEMKMPLFCGRECAETHAKYNK